MEKVLEVYKRPYDPNYPMVCMDESPKQLIKETRVRVPMSKGRTVRIDYEYKREGVRNIFMASEPMKGQRIVQLTQRKTKEDWARFVKGIAEAYPKAKRITLVMDQLDTHKAGSLYDTYSPEEAKALWDRFEFINTPKHGSWLNMAEIELSVLNRQCLNRRIGDPDEMAKEVAAWVKIRNQQTCIIEWRFETKDARIKLKKLYPTIIT